MRHAPRVFRSVRDSFGDSRRSKALKILDTRQLPFRQNDA
jgi:hypothetical protein